MRKLTATLFLGLASAGMAQPALAHHDDDHVPSYVTVQNNFDEPVTVYVQRGPFDQTIGSVEAMSITTLMLPEWAEENATPERAQLLVRYDDGITIQSREFELTPGTQISMIVPRPRPTFKVIASLPPDKMSETTLTVFNEDDYDLVVYAEEGELNYIELGSVKAHTTATLEFPESALEDNRLKVVVVDENGFEKRSQTLELNPPAHLALRLRD